MDIETNKNIIQKYYASFNKGGDMPFEDYFSCDFIDHNGYPGQIKGPEGVREGYKVWSRAFPDNHAELVEIIAENDKVAVRTIATGTHKGVFMGISPTGKVIRVEGVSIYRLEKGLIIERWGLTEGHKLLKYLHDG